MRSAAYERSTFSRKVGLNPRALCREYYGNFMKETLELTPQVGK
jgi:hypothetical protein